MLKKTKPFFAVNHFQGRGVWLVVREERAFAACAGYSMQELVLVEPGGATHVAATNRKETELEHEAAQAERRREFEERLAECGPLAYRVARGVLRHTADAEDVAQEALLRAYNRFDRLRDRTRFKAWLVRIAFRLALDRLRSKKRRDQRDTVWSQLEHRFGEATAEDLAAANEFQGHLENALAELPEKLRLVLLLAAMDGHTIEEIAGMLGIPVGTVKSRIFLARKQLAEKLRCHANRIETR